MILGLFTELLTAGGIQRIGRHSAAVLTALARKQGVPCSLLSLNDPLGRHEFLVGDLSVTILGFGRRKSRFVLSVLGAAPRTHLAYFGHPSLALLGLVLRLLRPGAHYLVTAHGIEVWKSLPLHRRLGLRFADAVTSLSRFTGEKMIDAQQLNPKKVIVLPPALDPGFLKRDGTSTRAKLSIPSGKVLLTVTRLAASEQYKGIENVIEALPKVLKVVPDTYYVVVGDGDDRQRLERLAKETGVADHVHFAGLRFGDELCNYYELCDIFVMPSRGEGFGLVFLEAMAFSRPVIGGNHGGTPEVVQDGVTGFLVENSDIDTLADRLIRLLRDEHLRKQMGESGRRRVEEFFTFEQFSRRLVDLLTKD